jgi:murein DD-endopeptidase MepM/ murein hydrolase activator NlpD
MLGRKRRNLYLERKRSSIAGLFTVLGLVLTALVAAGFYMAPRERPPHVDLPTSTYTDRFAEEKDYRENFREVVYWVQPGDTLYQILGNHGVESHEIGALIAASRSEPDFQRLGVGERLELFFDRDSQRLEKIRHQDTHGQVLTMSRLVLGWVNSRYSKPFVTTLAAAQGAIRDSLYQSAIDEGIDFELAMELADIFAWDIDFFVDLRARDNYQFLYERRFRDGKLIENGRIIAANFFNDGTHHRAYYYQVPGRPADYYNDDGRSLRKIFLKSPLRYARISSGFSKRRLHPILKIYRPHLGIDYAAPAGTPVVAVGDGRVTFKGWKSGYGRFIAIRHHNRYTTTYGHLFRYASKVSKGSTVKQGQVIGFVGASGLATGPHLDFRMKKDGRFVNPLRVRFPAARPIPPDYLEPFRQRVAYLKVKLGRLLEQVEPLGVTAAR